MTRHHSTTPTPIVEVHYRVLRGNSDLPPHEEADAPVEVVDVARLMEFLLPEILRSGQPWLQGVLAITVDGEPWNGGFDNYGAFAPRLRYFCCRDFYCEVDWLRAVTALLEGSRTVTLYQDDDETPPSIARSRQNQLKIWYDGLPDPPVLTDLQVFAEALAREGAALLRFTYRLLGEAYAQLGKPDLPPQATMGLEKLIQYLQACDVKAQLARLQKAMLQAGNPPSLQRVWTDVMNLMEDHVPTILPDPEATSGTAAILIVEWKALPSTELPYLHALATHPQRYKKLVWQNPFQKRPLAHFLEAIVLEGEGAILKLRTTLPKQPS